MADGKELKPKSFRIDDDTADKLKEISSRIGGNQQETISKLIEAYEFQSGKAILIEKKPDIEQFEKYITALTRMYMKSLEDNHNMIDTVRTEFDAFLTSKDVTIQDLQGKLKVIQEETTKSNIKAKSYDEENTRLNSVIESYHNEYNSKIDDMQSMLTDKEKLNKALADSCNDLKHKIDNMQQVNEQFEDLLLKYNTLKQDSEQLKRFSDNIEKDLKQEYLTREKTISDMKQHETDSLKKLQEQMQIAHEKIIFNLEKNYQEHMQKLIESKQTEIDKYQQKYLDLLEKIQEYSNNEKRESDILQPL